MAIENSTLALGTTTLLTIPAGKEYAITTIIFCNTYTPDPADLDLGEASFDLHLITAAEILSAGSASAAAGNINRVINGLNLKAGESYSFDSEKLILSAGDAVHIVATLSGNLSATVSYLEI
jgi:hypothetical protein